MKTKNKIILLFLLISIPFIGSFNAYRNNEIENANIKKELTGVYVDVSSTQLKISIMERIHHVTFVINDKYTYETDKPYLSAGTYTEGLMTFITSEGLRFNPDTWEIMKVTVLCDEGKKVFNFR